MGTSTPFGGTPSGIVPSWVDEPNPAPAQSPEGPEGTEPSLPFSPALVPASTPYSFSHAKAAYSQYLNSGQSSNMHRAMRDYVHSSGKSGGATRRMGSSRATAGGLVNFINTLSSEGIKKALRIFKLTDYENRPADEILLALTEIICSPGGTIDESIARNAMHETIAELIQDGITDLSKLSNDQHQELLINYIANSIIARIINDIGHGSIKLPKSIVEVAQLEQNLTDFTKGHARSAVHKHFHIGAQLTDTKISELVDNIYSSTFQLATDLTVGD